MDTAFVLAVKQEMGGGRSSASVNCHDFIGVNSKLHRLTLSIAKLPRADRIGHNFMEIHRHPSDPEVFLLIMLGVGQGLNLILWWSRSRIHYFKAFIVTEVNWGLSWTRLSLSIIKILLANLWFALQMWKSALTYVKQKGFDCFRFPLGV